MVALAAGPWVLGSNRRPSEDLDPGLLRAILSIRRGFSTGTSDPILSLVPADSKVYLAVGTIAPEPSFYSRDQLGALLRKAFETYTTVQFTVRFDRLDGGGESSEMVLCPASWIHESHGSRSEVKLRFILTKRPATWTLKEIRQTL